jgi:tetratricopeptide (TPR) repeat protein
MNTSCIDENRVLAFLDGSIPADDRARVEEHLAGCNVCMELVTLAAGDNVDHDRPAGTRPFIGRLVPGSRVARYQILNAIGRGGMGEVYAAYHPDLDRRIALKIVGDLGAAAPDRSARLLREARAIAHISHPNVITVHDAGTVDDHVYIAMEFIEGQTLDAWVRAQPRGWREVLDVFVAAGRGLAAAHAAGVVHRDFKPQNVMIGRDGSVRVMDFGLARLDEEPVESGPGVARGDAPPLPPTVTKTGTIVGTPAYMAPEQFRRETLDGRADQFSFCVALHEALHGHRPALAHLQVWPDRSKPDSNATNPNQHTGAPTWLRGVIARGLSDDRDDRFPSMDALLAAVNRGQRRVRQRTTGLGVGIAVALLSVGAWRLADARRVSCSPPTERLAAVWSGDESNPRRKAVHRAFTALGRSTAETAWQQVARALDDYTAQWSAMYVQTCEATNVRGEQSGEVLDLRMGCLSEALDGARALTEVLARADQQTMLSQTVTATQDLAALGRCTDVAALRSAVPLPRDERTAETVRGLRRELRDANALEDVGNNRAAVEAIHALLPRIEATGYKPLIAEALYLKGALQLNTAAKAAEADLENAFYRAEASRDDVTAAKAVSALVYIAATSPGRRQDSDRWAAIGFAILDRLAVPQPRIRAWILHNQGVAAGDAGDFESGRRLLEQAIALKERELGPNHPDVARTANALAWMMTELGQPGRALPLADRAVTTLALDPDSLLLAFGRNNRGDALNALGRYAEAEDDYRDALRIIRAQLGATHYKVAYPLHGLGEARLGRGDPAGAVRELDAALKLKQGQDPDPLAIADTQFALARALVASGQDLERARALALAARAVFARHDQTRKQNEVVAWLGARRPARTH